MENVEIRKQKGMGKSDAEKVERQLANTNQRGIIIMSSANTLLQLTKNPRSLTMSSNLIVFSDMFPSRVILLGRLCA